MSKKVAVWSNSSIAKTGFGKHSRILIEWLQDHGYDVIELACGMGEGDPILSVLPWPAFGLTPADPNVVKHAVDNGAAQHVGYGRLLVANVIKREKPDVIVAVEDCWAWNGLMEEAIFKQMPENWIFWSPIDSLPIYKEQAAFFRTAKHSGVKASFAQKALKKEGIETNFWPALIYSDSMRPNRAAGLALRENSGISDDTLVFGFVFRNQLRKLVIPQFQALKMFKDKYPQQKAKLIYHTNPFEPGQWNCVRHAQLEGLDFEDVFYTQACPFCRVVKFGPALTEEKMCECGKGKLHHPGPSFGVTEDQLNVIYNSFDGYIQSATSGGYEMCVSEALLAGVPTACTNYSFGEMFVDSGFVYPLPFTTYNEIQAGYIKAHTTPEGILSFMEHVKNSSSQEKETLRVKQIEWAKDFTDNDKICRQVADVIDSIPPPNYDWKFPRADAPMPQDEKNEDFARNLLYSVFGEIAPEPFNQAIVMLKEGHSRETIYNRALEIAANHKNLLEAKDVFKEGKKILAILNNEKQALEFGAAADELIEKHQGYDIYILTGMTNRVLVEHLPVNIIYSETLAPGVLQNTNWSKLVDILL